MTLLSAVESGPVPRLLSVRISDVCLDNLDLTGESM
jgi:hypothetical protein